MHLNALSIAAARRMMQAGFVVLSVALPLASWSATCPENITTCLGSASEFKVVGNRVSILYGTFSNGSRQGSVVDGSVCATTAKMKGGRDRLTSISGDVILLAESGTAVRFVALRDNRGTKRPGTLIDGDVITAGGSIEGSEWAGVNGVVDTSGSHPKLDLCRQAMVDAAHAASVLGNLPATEDLGNLTVLPFETHTLAFTGTSAQVKSAVGMRLMPDDSLLGFDVADTVDSAIVNVERSVYVGYLADIDDVSLTFGHGKVLNFPRGGKVKVATLGGVGVTTLAPQARIKVLMRGFTCELYGREVVLKGAWLVDTCLPPASPSGAFVDISDTIFD
jgi:hypothetical protein